MNLPITVNQTLLDVQSCVPIRKYLEEKKITLLSIQGNFLVGILISNTKPS